MYTYQPDPSLACLPSAIEDVPSAEKESLLFYPQPSNGLTNFFQPISAATEISITRLSGELIYQENTEITTDQIDLSFLESGIYFIRVAENGNQIRLGKIVIIN